MFWSRLFNNRRYGTYKSLYNISYKTFSMSKYSTTTFICLAFVIWLNYKVILVDVLVAAGGVETCTESGYILVHTQFKPCVRAGSRLTENISDRPVPSCVSNLN